MVREQLMEKLTYAPLVVIYQVAWYAAATLIWLASMGSQVAISVIRYLTRSL